MSKSFRKVSPIKLRSVLEVAEKLIVMNNENEKNKVLNDLYILLHPYIGKCKNIHQDWRDFGDNLGKDLEKY